MIFIYLLPGLTFLLIWLCEIKMPCVTHQPKYLRVDWLLNFIGLFMQGVFVPLVGILIASYALPHLIPSYKGILPLGWWGGFLLNFILIDFLYYWQHRLFHKLPYLWSLHQCHHASPRLDIWATSRNNLWINLLFVYILVNPFLSYFCVNPNGFYFGAMLTASLDILRHSQIDTQKLSHLKIYKFLGLIFVTPEMHRAHHNASIKPHNYGANLIIWDIIFKSRLKEYDKITQYKIDSDRSIWEQFWYPLAQKASCETKLKTSDAT